MSNRFHSKWHRYNHHTDSTPNVPDSGKDPIASHEVPFQGDFVIEPTTGGILSAKYIKTNNIAPFDGQFVDVPYPYTLRVSMLCAVSATVNFQDILVSELSGFWVQGLESSMTVPPFAPTPGQNNVSLDGVGISANRWAVFDGEVQVGELTVMGCLSTDCIHARTGTTINVYDNIDMQNHSISGIANDSLAFESGAKIQSDGVGTPGRVLISSYSVAENKQTGTTAAGQYAHAEGNNTTVQATSIAGHAEGKDTTVRFQYSHAEGQNTETTINAQAAHAEGSYTIADQDNSHVEGYRSRTIDGGRAGHAEGYRTVAKNNGSHSEGYQTSALQDYSHAAGYEAHTNNEKTYIWSSDPAQTTTTKQFMVCATNGIVLAKDVDITGNLTLGECLSTDCISPTVTDGTINIHGNIDMNNHSISGIGGSSISFISGQKITIPQEEFVAVAGPTNLIYNQSTGYETDIGQSFQVTTGDVITGVRVEGSLTISPNATLKVRIYSNPGMAGTLLFEEDMIVANTGTGWYTLPFTNPLRNIISGYYTLRITGVSGSFRPRYSTFGPYPGGQMYTATTPIPANDIVFDIGTATIADYPYIGSIQINPRLSTDGIAPTAVDGTVNVYGNINSLSYNLSAQELIGTAAMTLNGDRITAWPISPVTLDYCGSAVSLSAVQGCAGNTLPVYFDTDIDMQGNSISGIGDSSLLFNGGMKIQASNNSVAFNTVGTAASDVVVIGKGATTTTADTVVIGSGALADQQYSIAIGKLADANGGIAIGYNSNCDGNGSIAIGATCETTNYGANAVAIGNGVTIGDRLDLQRGDSGVGIGVDVDIFSEQAVAIGRGAKVGTGAAGFGGTAVGFDAETSAVAAIAIGQNSRASATGAVQLGAGTNSTLNSLQFQSTNLKPLFDGSSADSLHTHSGLGTVTLNYCGSAVQLSAVNDCGTGVVDFNTNIDMNNHSISGIANDSLTFESGAKIQSNSSGNILLSGNVGIGHALPAYNLDVRGASPAIMVSADSGIPSVRVHSNTDNFPLFQLDDGRFNSQWNIENGRTIPGNLGFYNSGTRMVITTAGNVGIGTTIPGSVTPPGFNDLGGAHILEVASSSDSEDSCISLRRSTKNSGLDIWHDCNSSPIYFDSITDSDNGDIIFRNRTLGTPIEMFRLDGDGGFNLGKQCVAAGSRSIAIGYNADPNNAETIAIGTDVTSTVSLAASTVAIGFDINAASKEGIAIGHDIIIGAPAQGSIGIGNNILSQGTNSIAIGSGAWVAGGTSGAIQIGPGTNSTSHTLQVSGHNLTPLYAGPASNADSLHTHSGIGVSALSAENSFTVYNATSSVTMLPSLSTFTNPATATGDFLVFNINGTDRGLRLWDLPAS